MENKFFNNIKNNFGFGMMRLPMIDKTVDFEQVSKMVDEFIGAGFNYFDTAHVYIDGQSEQAVKKCLSSRYPRDAYILTNKLTGVCFNSQEEILPLFESQLEACGVEYFDYYLMHAQRKESFKKYKECKAYETAFELKKQGKVKHVGISFHDDVECLKEILDTYPEIEVVQIQYNYLDLDDPSVQSEKLMKLLEEYKKPVIVMEPVKGGKLVDLPSEAKQVLDELKGGTPASYAIRFAASNPYVMMVLSGMSNTEQMADNISFMQDFKELNNEERNAIKKVTEIIQAKKVIPCTACRYCVTENKCPVNINIPEVFNCYNAQKIHEHTDSSGFYHMITSRGGKASDCIQCGACEAVCPQGLAIRDYLQMVAEEFEK